MEYLKEIKNKMTQAGIILKGITNIEIEELEKKANGSLPKCYVEFLQIMGKKTIADKSKKNWYFNYAGFQGTTVFFPSVKYLNEALEELLEEDESNLELPENAFVFYDSQGILSAFFKLDEGDNPPIYGYEEGFEGVEFPQIADSLSSFYERHLGNDKTLFQELR